MRFYTVALLVQSISLSMANLAHYQVADIADSQKRFNCYDQIFDNNGLQADRATAYSLLSQGRLSEITIATIESKLGNLRYGTKVMYKSSVPGARYYAFPTEGDGEGSTFYTYTFIVDSHGHLSAILGRITTAQRNPYNLSVEETFCTIA